MPQGITGQVTTYNSPNFVGELFNISREETPFLSTIGGLTGGASTGAKLFEWQYHDLREAEINRQRLEGADAPQGTGRARGNAFNVVEIHQEAVEVTYTRQGINRQRSTAGMPEVTIGNTVIPADELAWQIDQELKAIATDVERTFIEGTFQNPTSNAQPRRTRGLLEAIETNVVAAPDLEAVTTDVVKQLFKLAYDNGGIRQGETRTLMVGSDALLHLDDIYLDQRGFREQERTVGGTALSTFITPFGRANIMLDPWMPADAMAVVDLSQCRPRFLEIPGKGHFFVEPLAKTGSADRVQIYGEIGLEYGNQRHHAKLVIGDDGEAG